MGPRSFLPLVLLFILLFGSCVTPEPIETALELEMAPVEPPDVVEIELLTFETLDTNIAPPSSDALARLLALWRAFPEKIQGLWASTEDWFVDLGTAQFRWADGRMLNSDYPYTEQVHATYLPMWDLEGLGLPIWERKILRENQRPFFELNQTYGFDPRVRNQDFLDLLYDAPTQETSESQMEWVRFLGLPIQIHPRAVPALRRVDEHIRLAQNSSSEVQDFIENLDQVWGFFWRPIAGTSRRSMHSYGIAVDLIPGYYGRRFPYWRWALESGYPYWWRLSPRDYWTPPSEIVRAFEEEGFIWGGRWAAFDTVHFEYRPEYMVFEQPLEILDEKP
ncbi:MAG: M15 family metallopeptidase [Spirochaetales bacterium]|nr:M15 family metallopeptidase [Spirochaetales bacterium]